MAKDEKPSPKVFISYSWTSTRHEEWVLDLSTRLVQDGIDVILDKWELREGQDKYAFMERMVTDKKVKKVIVVSDKKYMQKANNRKGGVGTETQIISKEIYDKVEQQKFIPIVTQKDENGQPFLPTFLKSRIYIDFSTAQDYHENYEQLLRCILDQPLYKKPKLGTIPKHIFEEAPVYQKTSPKLEGFKNAVLQERSTNKGFAIEYLNSFKNNLENFRIKPENDKEPFDEKILRSWEEFLPYRNEFIDFLSFVCIYTDGKILFENIHEFFQDILKFKFKPEDTESWLEHFADNYGLIVYELFIYLLAVLIKHKKFFHANIFLSQQYFLKRSAYEKYSYVDFTEFFTYSRIVEKERNQRLNLNRLSIISDLLQSRCTYKGLDFELLMTVDFILFLRSILSKKQSSLWYPRTLVYAGRFKTFELFARAASNKFFENIKILIQVDSKDDLVEKFRNGYSGHELNRWEFDWRSPGILEELLNFENLCTLP